MSQKQQPPSPVTVIPPLERFATTERSVRVQLLRDIETERGSRVIAYITEPRPQGFGTGISSDVSPILYEHLRKIGKVERIDILLHTHGGDTLAPSNIVHLFREFCDHLGVLVPAFAMSAGTMVALGANEIVLGCVGRLGPVDPTVGNDFNPQVELTDEKGKKTQRSLPISVEDVAAYLSLARETGKLDDHGMAEAFRALTDKVHPLALGNVHRKYLLIRAVSKRLLHLHMNAEADRERIEGIVNILTEGLYDHAYQISRQEARSVIGLPVVTPPAKLDGLMWSAYQAYRKALHLDGAELPAMFALDTAVIETTEMTHSFVIEGVAQRSKDGVNIEVKNMRWGLAASLGGTP